jgi:parvulin-like peptidyl-prolyl isomerase
MARRTERTTALPRPRPRPVAADRRKIGGIAWGEEHLRLGILAGAGALLLLVLGMLGYGWYDNHIATPNKVVLTVGSDQFKLNYYADRLYQFVQANQTSGDSVTLLEQQLLTNLEDEALTIQLAQERGVNLSDDEITKQIASELGVPVGGPGSSFDTLYRQRLKTTKMSDANYRRLAEATLAKARLLDQVTNEVGDTGDMLSIRAVVSNSKDNGDAVLTRVKNGEDLGGVAQSDSTDLQSRQNDGLMLPEPPALLPDNIRTAIEGKQAGSDLFGPIQVQTDWWVFRVDKRDPTGQYSDAQKSQLAQAKLDETIKAKRASTRIVRKLSASDVVWAEKHSG